MPVESQFVGSNFPKTLSDYNASVGAIYSNLSSQFAVPYWRMQDMSTDEAILPARDGNFDDGGQYRQLHYHTWTPRPPQRAHHLAVAYGGITTCNRLLNITTSFGFTPAEQQARLAEIRAMRALYYFFLLDLYGNVPIVTDYPVTSSPATMPRAEVYKFIESELDRPHQAAARQNRRGSHQYAAVRPPHQGNGLRAAGQALPECGSIHRYPALPRRGAHGRQRAGQP
ncbi:MAG: RagB/SusD family nutrient uptake outer membrane protein [Hymenobacter sp.]